MGRIIRLRRNRRRSADVGSVPVTPGEYDRIAEQPEEPDDLGSGRARPDASRTGSIEAVPQAAPEDSVACFFEPPADLADGAPMPPHLQER